MPYVDVLVLQQQMCSAHAYVYTHIHTNELHAVLNPACNRFFHVV
jgi:hypothetical protein